MNYEWIMIRFVSKQVTLRQVNVSLQHSVVRSENLTNMIPILFWAEHQVG